MRRDAVEILAPAGSWESMAAAFNAGADAVYIGGSRFGARAFADNLDEARMVEAIRYAHLHGRKLYMTVNTLMKEEELSELYAYLKPYYEAGLDAVIVQDMGVFSLVKQYFPGLHIHASTQMTVTGAEGAKILAALGAERVVTARELSLEEIRRIHRETGVEIESFVHGALCYCYSGQCLLSSVIGGRSGNRGRCAQPCRLPYEVKKDGRTLNRRDERYVLSLKDLCTLKLLPDILEAGVYSLKIEGRMKSPRYTAGVVSIYRKYVDKYLESGREGYRVDPADEKQLLELFDRGGFTAGYYREHNGRDMVALKEKPAFREGNAALFDYLDKTYVNAALKEPMTGCVRLAVGCPAVLTLESGGQRVEVTGETVLEALNRPMDEAAVAKQMKKTGNTPFTWERLTVELDGQVFLPVQALNDLRRRGVEALERAIVGQYERVCAAAARSGGGSEERQPAAACVREIPADDVQHEGFTFAVSLERPDALDAALRAVREASAANTAGRNERFAIYLDSTGFPPSAWKDAVKQCRGAGASCLLKLPQIFRQEARRYFETHRSALFAAEFDGLVIGSMEEIQFLKDMGWEKPLVFDHNLYGFNHMAAEIYESLGAVRQTIPLELNYREILKTGGRGKELIVYGHMPVMVSAQCIQKTVGGCTKKEGILTIKDRMGKEFPVKNHCRFCCNTIYNTSPLSLLHERAAIGEIAPAAVRLQFTVESPEETGRIVRAFADAFAGGLEVKDPLPEMTRGHFRRGAE